MHHKTVYVEAGAASVRRHPTASTTDTTGRPNTLRAEPTALEEWPIIPVVAFTAPEAMEAVSFTGDKRRS